MDRTRMRIGIVVAIVVLCATAFARAEEPAPATPEYKPVFSFGFSAGLSTMAISNSHFGRGLIWPLPTPDIPLQNYKKDISRTETYIAPKISMDWKLGEGKGTVFGAVRGVYSATTGDGDTFNLTAGNPNYTDLDSLYVGWKSAQADPAKVSWEVSYGYQDFQLADGMVLVDGDNEAGAKAVYWSDPRKAWDNAALIKVNAAPFRLELFSLNCDGDAYTDAAGNPLGGNLGDSIQGANVEWGNPQQRGILGASYFHISDSDLDTRHGMAVSAVHGRGKPFKSLPTLEFGGEYNWQRNSAKGVEAAAWFAEATYTFLVPWYPTIGYRYASFSGDDGSTEDTNEGWDSLHNGFTPRGFGYWYQGLVVGTYETLLSNLNVGFVNLTVAPPMLPGSWVKVLYYDHNFDDKSTATLFPEAMEPVSSDEFATEWDFIVGYSPTKKYDVMLIYAQASPDQGGKERNQGFDKDESLVQFTVLFHY